MKSATLMGWSLALGLSAMSARAQATNQVEQLQQRLNQLQENFERQQSEQLRQIESLRQEIQTLQSPSASAAAPPRTTVSETIAAAPGTNNPAASSSTAGPKPEAVLQPKGWSPADPIRLGSATAYLDLGASITVAAGGATTDEIEHNLELGHHDPGQRGFTLQGVELSLSGAVDPYFRGNINLSYGITPEGESGFEFEEGWIETVSLPANLQVRAGQGYTAFGRQNSQHLHTWSFVDTPLVNGRFLGPDALRNPGAWVSWLMPVPVYSQLMFGLQNSQGETAASFRGGADALSSETVAGVPFAYRPTDNDRGVTHFQDMLMSARYEVSTDLTDAQTLLLGFSGAFGPNSRGGANGGDTRTTIGGTDLTWKWTSPRQHGGFPFVAWQTEAMVRSYQAGSYDWATAAPGEPLMTEIATGQPAYLPLERLTDYGLYSQVRYGFRKGWVAGLRYDWVAGQVADYEKIGLLYDEQEFYRDPARAPRWRLSPNMTWYPTEFSKLRLQFNYDHRDAWPDAYSVWLQLEVSLGAHAAHKF
jgi:hypothetical protein